MRQHSVARYQRLNGRRSFSVHRHRGRGSRLFLYLILIVIACTALSGGYLYFAPAGRPAADTTYLLVAPGSRYSEVHEQMQKKLWLRFPRLFGYVASWQGLNESTTLRPGRYAIPRSTTMLELVSLLQEGKDTPLQLTPPSIRQNGELVDFLSEHLWLKADSLRTLIADSALMAHYGTTSQAFYAEVIREPHTLRWASSGRELLDSIHAHYQRFWQEKRTSEAARLGLSPLEVTTLASIVESESSKRDEYRRIAGLYLNRLRKEMRLQSDPTVKYAVGNFDLKRIRSEHLSVNSPYNTYKVKGLPPTPIILPRTSTIDSVLAAETHDYIYMCAKEDFSGYHNFAATFAQHQQNAKRYQQALNDRGIQ